MQSFNNTCTQTQNHIPTANNIESGTLPHTNNYTDTLSLTNHIINTTVHVTPNQSQTFTDALTHPDICEHTE